MKNKIIGIFVCMLMIVTMAIPTSAMNKEYTPNKNPQSLGVDVPIWEIGDSWTYNMEIYTAASPNVTDDMVFEASGEITFEVVDDTDDTYKLTGTAKRMTGTIDIPGNIDMRITRLSSYSSDFELQKTDLAIINHEFTNKGIVLLTLGPIPLPIPIQMQSSRYTEFNPPLNMITFPLNDGDFGTIEDVTVTESGVTSMFWGLIPIVQVDIHDWPINEREYTVTFESISVPAGTFDVYTVETENTWGDEGIDWLYSYYAEEVGNVAKLSVNMDYEEEVTYYNLELELVSTTYEP